ncbi:MAG TPA: M23 family metallopeptidase [Spirochaetia bacterium]
MMTVLQTQHVSKRASSPSTDRHRAEEARWDTFGLPSAALRQQSITLTRLSGSKKPLVLRPHREEGHSFLKGQLVRAKRPRPVGTSMRTILQLGDLPRREERRAPWGRERLRGARERPRAWREARVARPPKPWVAAVLRVLTSPWLLIAIVSAAAIAFLVYSLGLASLAFPPARPALPVPEDVDQALYSLVIPEPAATRPSGVNPVLLQTLKVTSYRTQPGDTLGKIAARFKLNVDTLVSWNDIRDARSIPAGKTFSIPNANGLKYVVRRGDTLQGIARSWSVDFNGVLDWNNLTSSTITPGQEIFLPGARMNADELGRIMGSLFIFPAIGRISSYFGERPDPFTGIANYHNGVDIVNPPGAPIGAAAAGTVADVGFNNNYGNYVILRHTGGYQTLYGHMTRYIVSRGQKVRQGQKIGEVGTTGYSTGPHVHFSIFRNGQPIDPMRFLK